MDPMARVIWGIFWCGIFHVELGWNSHSGWFQMVTSHGTALGSTSGGIVRGLDFHPKKMVGRWNISRSGMVWNPILMSKIKKSELLVFNVFRQLQSFLGFVISFLRSSPWPEPKGDHPHIWGFFRILRVNQLFVLQILCQMLFDKIHMKPLRQTTSWYSSHVLLTCRSQEIWQNPNHIRNKLESWCNSIEGIIPPLLYW